MKLKFFNNTTTLLLVGIFDTLLIDVWIVGSTQERGKSLVDFHYLVVAFPLWGRFILRRTTLVSLPGNHRFTAEKGLIVNRTYKRCDFDNLQHGIKYKKYSLVLRASYGVNSTSIRIISLRYSVLHTPKCCLKIPIAFRSVASKFQLH